MSYIETDEDLQAVLVLQLPAGVGLMCATYDPQTGWVQGVDS